MQTAPEGDIHLFRPRGIKALRLIPGTRVAVRRRQQQANLVPTLKAMAQHLDRRIGMSREQMQRRIKAQQFLDRARDPVRRKG